MFRRNSRLAEGRVKLSKWCIELFSHFNAKRSGMKVSVNDVLVGSIISRTFGTSFTAHEFASFIISQNVRPYRFTIKPKVVLRVDHADGVVLILSIQMHANVAAKIDKVGVAGHCPFGLDNEQFDIITLVIQDHGVVMEPGREPVLKHELFEPLTLVGLPEEFFSKKAPAEAGILGFKTEDKMEGFTVRTQNDAAPEQPFTRTVTFLRDDSSGR